MIRYAEDATAVAALTADDLAPFFEGWPVPPSPQRRLASVRGADHVALAFDGDRLVGFATALSDGALMSSLSLLEVVASHRNRGIGRELVRRMGEATSDRYGLDVVCDRTSPGSTTKPGSRGCRAWSCAAGMPFPEPRPGRGCGRRSLVQSPPPVG